jgi:SPP1 gp7 family putative phage head morphogenesis protein
MPGLDGNDRQRTRLERMHADKLAKALRKVQAAVIPPGTTPDNITPSVAVERYRANQQVIRDTLVEMLLDAVNMGERTGLAQVEWILGTKKDITSTQKATIGISWDLVSQVTLDWLLGTAGAPGYADILTDSVGMASANALRRHVAEWITNGLPLRVLVENMQRSTFSVERATLIATTEVTRAYAEGNRAAWRASGIIQQMRWQTSADEMVCPVCRPLSGQVVEVGADGFPIDDGEVAFPPAHPRCRCWVVPAV